MGASLGLDSIGGFGRLQDRPRTRSEAQHYNCSFKYNHSDDSQLMKREIEAQHEEDKAAKNEH